MISLIVSLFEGSVVRILLMRSLASLDTPISLKLYLFSLMFSQVYSTVLLQKGGVPQSKVQIMTPRDQMSDSQECPSSSRISGAMQLGVPQMVLFLWPMQLLRVDNPKSHSFSCILEFTRMFPSFRSLWITALLCITSRALTICKMQTLVQNSESLFLLLTSSFKVLKGQNSRTMYTLSASSKTSMNLTMFSCLNILWILISNSSLYLFLFSLISFFGITFAAYMLPSFTLRTSKHLAKPPVPNSFPRMYLFSPFLSVSTFSPSIQILDLFMIAEEQEEEYPQLGMERLSSIKAPQIPDTPIVSDEVYDVEEYEKKGEHYVNEYLILETLGEGSYGKVKRVERTYLDDNGQPTKSIYAMKIYDRSALERMRFFSPDLEMINGTQVIENELNIVKRLDHNNVVRCFQIIDDLDHQKLYTTIQYCDLGQPMVFSDVTESYEISEKVTAYLKESYKLEDPSRQQLATIIFKQVGLGLKYMHDRNTTHRDIKIDNILLRTGKQGEEVKVADFSTARYSDNDMSYQTAGTPHFKAPEQQFAAQNGYSSKASDIWSLGVTIYLFCFDKFPFVGESELELDIKALNNEIQYPEDASKEVVQLIKGMTMKDPKARPTILEVLSHPWFQQP